MDGDRTVRSLREKLRDSTDQNVTASGAIEDTPPQEIARTLKKLISGPTPDLQEKSIVWLLARLGRQRDRLQASMYELSRLGAHLPDKLITDVADLSLWDRLKGRDVDPDVTALWKVFLPDRAFPDDPDQAIRQLRKAALSCGSRGDPVVEAYLRDKIRRQDGVVEVMGREIERIMEKPGEIWQEKIGYHVYRILCAAAYKSKFAGWMTRLVGVCDVKGRREVDRAISSPPVKNPDGSAKQIGDIAVLVNGWLNFSSSAPAVFRLARHLRGPVLLANTNPNGPDGYRLRELDELWGVSVPPQLKHKIWAIGEMAPNLVGWPQASDLLLEHLAVIGREFHRTQAVNPGMQDVRSFPDAHTTVFAHSQGGPAAAAARVRLNQVGLGHVIDRLVAVNSPLYEGALLADGVDSARDVDPVHAGAAGERHVFVRVMQRVLAFFTTPSGRQSFRYNDPDTFKAMRDWLGWSEEDVDFSYTTQVGRLRWNPKNNKSEPGFAILAGWSTRDRDKEGNFLTDGLIPIRSSRPDLVSAEKKGHLITWEDQDTFNEIIEALPDFRDARSEIRD